MLVTWPDHNTPTLWFAPTLAWHTYVDVFNEGPEGLRAMRFVLVQTLALAWSPLSAPAAPVDQSAPCVRVDRLHRVLGAFSSAIA